MKLPAIKSKIGNWDYYVTTLTFQQVNDFVEKIDGNLYHSEALKDLIQRSITKNFLSIRDYILNQPELFFNSLVLAVYDNYPTWHQVIISFENDKINNFGMLEFPGPHKIFPVDGQHRVEGIKQALKENPKLKNQHVAAIFIGHKADEHGKKRTRRLFTTLNRYAKPVSLRDSIALDEDDIVAIVTRDLLEEFDLFTGGRIIDVKNKAIPNGNNVALTSIITLYQANMELLKFFLEKELNIKPNKTNIETYLKFRPKIDEINLFKELSTSFWSDFKKNITSIKTFLKTPVSPAATFRNTETGGNLLFRPVGFLPFVKAAIEINRRTNKSFSTIFKGLNKIDLNLESKPWVSTVWNSLEKKMIMNTSSLTYLLISYLYDEKILTNIEKDKLKEGYAAQTGMTGSLNKVWKEIKQS